MRTTGRYSLGIVFAGLGLLASGCTRKANTTGPTGRPVAPRANTPPAEASEKPGDNRRSGPALPATRPTSQPAGKPASQPAPKFVVIALGPDGKERHWIAVEKWTKGLKTGRVVGRWVGPNKMQIAVQGARQVVLKLGRLPIQSGRRIVLHIEDARMELKRSLLPTVRLRRSPTGSWSAVKNDDK